MSKKEGEKGSSKKKSKQSNKGIAIAIVGVLVFFAILLMVQANGRSNNNGNGGNLNFNQQCRQVPYSEEECKDVPYTDQEAYYEQECQQVPYTDQECESQKLVYRSTMDQPTCATRCINDHEECQEYFLGICTSWETVCDVYENKCTASITNLDTKKGSWTYQWSSSCSSPTCVLSDQTNVGTTYGMYLDPTESDTTWAAIYYKSSQYRQENHLSIKIISEPTKQVCRDVIKYRQECQQVTRYRPVTRYRTDCTTVTKYREECS